MDRDPIFHRESFPASPMPRTRGIRYYPGFHPAIPEWKAGWSRVTHPFATLCTPEGALIVRLACVKHAASVHPEPGSNSPFRHGVSPVPHFVSTLVVLFSSHTESYDDGIQIVWLIRSSQYPVFKVPDGVPSVPRDRHPEPSGRSGASWYNTYPHAPGQGFRRGKWNSVSVSGKWSPLGTGRLP